MKIKYDSESDILLFILRDDPPVDTIEESGGIIVSFCNISYKPFTIKNNREQSSHG